jgi:bacterioferritin
MPVYPGAQQSQIHSGAAVPAGVGFRFSTIRRAVRQNEDVGYNLVMRGNEEILRLLNEVLKAELTAINQYFLHAKMCENWGYQRLAALDRQESIEEMHHADILMQRILFLEGMPNMTELFPIKIGPDVKAQLENDLALELDAVPRLNEAIKVATQVGDNGSRELFKQILLDEEHHIDYLEGQLHIVEEIGLDNYLAQQIHAGGKG